MKNDNITLLNQYRLPVMGAAALYILFLHTGIMGGEGILFDTAIFIRRMGFLGVDVFLLLSGIGLVYSFEKGEKKVWHFWKRRILRIFLPMLIMAVCYCLTEHWSIKEFVGYITGYHYYMIELEKSFLWFYFAIATFYIFFPLYYFALDYSPNKNIFTIMMLCVWFALSLAARGHIRDDMYWMINRIPVFLTGIWLGRRMWDGKTEIKRYVYPVMVLALAIGLYLEYLILYREQKTLLPHAEFGLAAYLAGISLAFLWMKGFALLDKTKTGIGKGIIKICTFFGVISYEFYCAQEWVFELFVEAYFDKMSIITLDIIIFISCVGAGLIVYWINQRFRLCYQYIFSKKE